MKGFTLFAVYCFTLIGSTAALTAFLWFGPGVQISGPLIGGIVIGVTTGSIAFAVTRTVSEEAVR